MLMRKSISLLFVLVLGFLASTVAEVQSAKAQHALSGQLSVTVSPSNGTTIDVGQYVQFTAFSSGGATPYSYQWYSNESLVPEATSSSFKFTPNRSGTFNVSVTVTDSSDNQAGSNGTLVTVNPWLNLRIEAGSSTTNVNQPVQFTAFVTGGTPPYQYRWYLSGEPVAGSTNQSFTFTPTSPGTYVIGLTVTDSVNSQAGGVALPLTIAVLGTPSPSPSPTPTLTPGATPTPTPTPSPSPTPPPALGTPAAHPMIAALATMIAAIIIALLMLEKRRSQSVEKPKP